jgi:hypothetical protein
MATVLNDVLPYDQVLDSDVRERLATRALRSALLLGIAGDLLLRGGGLGINALLYTLLVAGSVWALDLERGDGATRARLPLLVPAVAAGLALAWRDSALPSVGAVMWFVLAIALHAAALRAGPAWNLWQLDPLVPVRAVLRLAGDAASQSVLLLGRDVPQGTFAGAGRWRSMAAGWRGLVAAIPLLLVFNALLMSADPVWAKQAERVTDVDLGAMLGHVIVTSVLAWMAGGWLRGSLLATPAKATAATPSATVLRTVDVLVPLWLVNALFAAFVAMQLRTLAGGAEYVKAVAGLTFAEYARHGFFQLVLVAMLTLPALLVADALTPLDHVARRSVRRGSLLTLVLLGGILASAGARMALYLEAYSLTEDRFYASVAMGWLALVIAWFGMTVLRDRRERFIGGALVSAFAVWAGVVAANPDAIITRANVARLERDGKMDARYLSQLGLDAAPMIVAALPRMTEAQACAVKRALAHDRQQREAEIADGRRDWRAWSLAGWRAERAWERGAVTTPWAGRKCPAELISAEVLREATERLAPLGVAAPEVAAVVGPVSSTP